MREREYTTTDLLTRPDPRGRRRIEFILGDMMIRNAVIAAGKTDEMVARTKAMVESLKALQPVASKDAALPYLG